MAAKKNEVAPAEKNELVTPYSYGEEFQGLGFEDTSTEDFAIPYLSLLQGLSPEVQEGPEYVEGARPGLMMNSVTKRLYPKEGVLFVPVCREHVYVEWRPRDAGGGLVARHEIASEFVRATKASQPGQLKLTTDEGNELQETFYVYGYTLASVDDQEPDEVMLLSFNSTKIKVYKQMMYVMNSIKGRPPIFANRLRITTQAETSPKGNYYNFKIQPALGAPIESLIPPQSPLLKVGQELYRQIKSGEARAADESLSGPSEDVF